jgi:hypothetical protein
LYVGVSGEVLRRKTVFDLTADEVHAGCIPIKGKNRLKERHPSVMKTERVDTWAASMEDKPGSLASKLSALADAGVNLEFVIGRRAPEKPGKGVVFVTPIKGANGCRAARKAGFEKTKSLHTLRIEGTDKPGQGAKVTQALADQGLNVRGLSAAAIGNKFVCHIALDKATDAAKAARIIKSL